MTMTLGFDVFGYLDALVGEDAARSVLTAIAEHAPGQSIRAGASAKPYAVQEISRDGIVSAPANIETIRAAIEKAGHYVSWANDEAPEGVPPIILPGAGWDLKALCAEPAMQKLIEREPFCENIYGSDRAEIWLDSRGLDLLAVADHHRLITVFR